MHKQDKPRGLPIHPIFFALSPILYFYSVNKYELSLLDTSFLATLFAVLIGTATIWTLLNLFFKNRSKAAIVTSLLIILFFSYGHVEKFVGDFNLRGPGFTLGPDETLLSLWSILAGLVFYLTIKTKKNLKPATKFLNIIAAALVLLSLIDIIPYEIQNAVTRRLGEYKFRSIDLGYIR